METVPAMKRFLPLSFLILPAFALTAAEPVGTPEQAAKFDATVARSLTEDGQ